MEISFWNNKNEKNEEATIAVYEGVSDDLREVDGVCWIFGKQSINGVFEVIADLSEGGYPITMRAALYQN